MKKMILTIGGIVLALVIVVGITKANRLIMPDNLLGDKKTEADTEETENKVSTAQGSIGQEQMLEEDINKVDEKNIHKMQDAVETRGIQYKVQSFHISKEIGDFSPQPGAWQTRCAVDADGNIAGNYSYVIADLEVSNVTDQVQTLSFYNCGLNLVNQKGKNIYESGYINRPVGVKVIQSQDLKSAYEYNFQPEERIEQILAIVEADEVLADNRIEFLIWPEGMQGYNTDSRIIQLYE